MDAYSALGEYMVTDLSKKDCSKIAKAILKNESLGKFTIDGTTSLDYLGFDEFLQIRTAWQMWCSSFFMKNCNSL